MVITLKNTFDNAIKLGIETIENGGEISRAEEIIKRNCIACGASEVHVFIIPYLIAVTIIYNNEEKTILRRTNKSKLNIGKLEEINNTSRSFCNNKNNNKNIDYNYSPLLSSLCVMIGVAAFCIFFGGNIIDALFSAISGFIVYNLPNTRISYNRFSRTLIASTISGINSFIPTILGFDANPDKIMIGTIMLFIPGLNVGISIRDMMSGNIIAGILELAEAIIITFAINLGFGIAILLFGSDIFA